jgi:flagellar protein FlgJ
MYDEQLSVALSQGRGLGLADLLVEQLTRTGLARAAASAGAATDAPAAGAAATGAPPTAAASQSEFLRALGPWAEAAGRRLGVAPETVLAHAALESGWGRHVPAADGQSSHNLFGIKALHGWNGAAVNAVTTEYDAHGPQRVNAGFRRYDSLAAGVADYAELLAGNSRYAAALNTGADVAAFAAALQRAGYATDPDYARKLVATAAAVRELRAQDGLKSAAGLPTNASGGSA